MRTDYTSRDWASAPDPVRRNFFLKSDWVKEVATTPDTPLRSHRITLTYSQLAAALDQLLFGDATAQAVAARNGQPAPKNANWFHFATWGAYTLGPNIRDDSAPQRLESLPSAIRKRVLPTIIHSRAAGGHLVGRALSWGENLIFMSAARALIQFDHQKQALMAPGANEFKTPPHQRRRLLEKLDHNGAHWLAPEHLTLIDRAFDCYALVRRYRPMLRGEPESPGEVLLARLCLSATVLLTVVEQDLVTSALRTLTESVPVRVVTEIDGRLAALIARRRDVPREVVAIDLLTPLSRGAEWLNNAFARFMTKEMLVMALPAETLRLGHDVPPRDPASPIYPPALDDVSVDKGLSSLIPDTRDRNRAIKYLTDLDNTVKSLSRTGDDGRGSAARDWRRFDDRLNWAICLFRSRQQDASLFWPPYSREDEHRIIDGLLPHSHAFDGVIPPLDPQAIGQFLGVAEAAEEATQR